MFCASSIMHAFGPVKVTFIDGIYNSSIKNKMEQNASKLLTAINGAKANGSKPNFHSMLLSNVANDISELWDFTSFECSASDIQAHCITTKNGYQLRNIPLLMESEDKNNPDAQEACINFSKNGDILNFHITVSSQQYSNIIGENRKIEDLQRRQQILDYVEQFRTSYEKQDTAFLRQVFSEDALIITGTVIKPNPRDRKFVGGEKIKYTRYTKNEYISKLKSAFKNSRRIRVTFDEISVTAHPTNNKLYGVTLKQGYTSSGGYHDDGFLFMYWDFSNEKRPQIRVRTWQPMMLDGKELNRNQIFGLGNF